MAKYGSGDAKPILIDGYDIAGYLTDLTDDKEASIEDVTALGDTWSQNASVHLNKFSVEVKGFYDDGADGTGGSNAAFVGKSGVTRILNYGVAGNAVGRPCTGIEGVVQNDYNRIAAMGTLTKIDVKFTGTGQVDEGIILLPLGALSGESGDGTAEGVALATTNGGVLYAQVTALTLGGYDDLKLVVEDSATEGGTYTEVGSVTFTTRGAKRLAITGTIDKFVRAHFEYEGTGTGESATAFVAFSRK